ncbi:hypothetical protein Aduo_015092 [Ancylostoma duodenale]
MFKLCFGAVLFAICAEISLGEYTHEQKKAYFEGSIEKAGGDLKKKYDATIAELQARIDSEPDEKMKEFGKKILRMIQEGAFVTPIKRIDAMVKQEIANAHLNAKQIAIIKPLAEHYYAKLLKDFGFTWWYKLRRLGSP